MTITLDGDQLMAQTGPTASGAGAKRLVAESETKFLVEATAAQLEFLKDTNGQVSQAILHQGAREQKGARISVP